MKFSWTTINVRDMEKSLDFLSEHTGTGTEPEYETIPGQ